MPDTDNVFRVTATRDRVWIQRPTSGQLTLDQALNLAVWLIVMADPNADTFPRLFAHIRFGEPL